MSLSSPIIAVLAHFEPLFTAPTWKMVMTLLARGPHTATAALRQMGQMMTALGTQEQQAMALAR